MGYTAAETAVKEKVLQALTPDLQDAGCQIADYDKALDAVFSNKSEIGCVLEFGGISQVERGDRFTSYVWSYEIEGVLFIRYSPTIEDELRGVVDRLMSAFDADPRLSGACDIARLTSIQKPDAIRVNDVPFYALPFLVVALQAKQR